MLAQSSRIHRFIAVVALGAALLVGGCGGDSDEEKTKDYREGLTEAKEKLDRELTQAGAGGRSRAQFGEDVEQLRAAIDEFKQDLDALDTPSDAENEEDAVTEVVDEFSASVGRINAAVQAKDKKRAAQEAARVQESGIALDQAIETLLEAVD